MDLTRVIKCKSHDPNNYLMKQN